MKVVMKTRVRITWVARECLMAAVSPIKRTSCIHHDRYVKSEEGRNEVQLAPVPGQVV